jgi:predicted RNA-binding protein with PIN domain
MQNVIVDGYNVIHADDRLKKTVKRDLQAARQQLTNRIARYLERKNLQVTLVFDGRGGLTDVDIQIPGKLQILFSSSGQTADEVIMEMLYASSNPRKYTVVTSDMADIGRAARASGAQLLSSREFLDRIRVKPGEAQTRQEEDTPVEDIDYWLKKFEKRDNPDEG